MDDDVGYTGAHVAELKEQFEFDSQPKAAKVKLYRNAIDYERTCIREYQNRKVAEPHTAWALDWMIETHEGFIRGYERELSLLSMPKDQLQRDEDAVAKAMAVRIDELIKFDKANMAKCIFHEEKHASLHYIKKSNRVHCFGCAKTFGAIDVFMKLNGVGFREAVKALSGN
jgi:hypothetical protein